MDSGKKIKVVHIIRGSYGGAGIAAIRLNASLNRIGVNSSVIVCDNDLGGEKREILGKGSLILRTNRWIEQRYLRTRREHEDYPFNCSYCGYNLHKMDIVKNADVIHLHWVCSALTIREISRLCALNKPVIWTCHDLWPFTGGCHYNYENPCPQYFDGCVNCCLLKEKSNIAKKNYHKKKKYLEKSQISLVAPSSWMKKMIGESFFKEHEIVQIPNAIDGDTFKPSNPVEEKTGSHFINLLFASASSSITYKGFTYLEGMLEHLLEQEPDLASRIVINILGAHNEQSSILKKYKSKTWGFIKNEDEMARIYSSCDLLAYPSYEDNLPSVVIESLLCETPVLAFDTGGIPDMIDHMQSGYVAKYRDDDDFYRGFVWILKNNHNNVLGKNGRQKCLKNFNCDRIAKMHLDIYEKEIKRITTEKLRKGYN